MQFRAMVLDGDPNRRFQEPTPTLYRSTRLVRLHDAWVHLGLAQMCEVLGVAIRDNSPFANTLCG